MLRPRLNLQDPCSSDGLRLPLAGLFVSGFLCAWVFIGCGHNPHLEARRLASAGPSESATDFSPLAEESEEAAFFDKQFKKHSPRLAGIQGTSGISFDWPMDEARLTQKFNPVRTRKQRRHLGIDLAAPRGTDIFAAHEGVVIYSGSGFRGFGKMILVEHPAGWATLYAHLSRSDVKMGERVEIGQPIAAVGNTGRSSGPHLHFELRQGRDPVDPLAWLPRVRNVGQIEAQKPSFVSLAVQDIIRELLWKNVL